MGNWSCPSEKATIISFNRQVGTDCLIWKKIAYVLSPLGAGEVARQVLAGIFNQIVRLPHPHPRRSVLAARNHIVPVRTEGH